MTLSHLAFTFRRTGHMRSQRTQLNTPAHLRDGEHNLVRRQLNRAPLRLVGLGWLCVLGSTLPRLWGEAPSLSSGGGWAGPGAWLLVKEKNRS